MVSHLTRTVRTCKLNLPINEGQGSTIHDSSGYGNHGTIYGATWTKGSYGYALSFDGVDDYVDCGSDSSLDISGDITIALWLYLNQIPSEAAYGFVGHEDYKNWLLYCWEDDIYFRYINTDDNEQFPRVVESLSIGLQHITCIWTDNDTTARFYVNGNYEGKFTGTGSIKSTDFSRILIGAVNPTTRLMNGTIAEALIYDRAWTADEVLSYYNATKGRFGL